LGLNLFSFLAILVTGGHGGDTSAELLSTNGSAIFELPKMSQPKRYHTQSGLTACGGYVFGSEERSCIRFEFGSWTNLTGNLLYRRRYHSSWNMPNGDILLIGGFESSSGTTSEIVDQNGTSKRSFDLQYNTRDACSIEFPEMFIVTGGEYIVNGEVHTSTQVSKYSTSGWIENLPELQEGREDHGCGYYYNDDMERVFLVAGGYDGYYEYISSTETLIEGGQAWNFQRPLPTGRHGLRAISLLQTVIMTGGYNGSILEDVLMFDQKATDWKKVGRMKTARVYHGASLVNMVDVMKYF